jgi:hypothetical protein
MSDTSLSIFSPRMGLPSMATIWSPGLIPARAAGDPSIGAMTVTYSVR